MLRYGSYRHNHIWTCGYGKLEGTHPERKVAFQERLRVINRGIGKPITLVDIREEGSGSRNGIWFRQYTTERRLEHNHAGMLALVNELECDVIYLREPHLCNTWGSTLAALKTYEYQLELALQDPPVEQAMREAVDRVIALARDPSRAVVLMCGCRRAFKANGKTWNCHRVPLALKLVQKLGPNQEWQTIHL